MSFARPPKKSRLDVALQARAAHPYVSRGGLKLAAALDHFGFNPKGRVCLDVGASTGGFTQVLLDRGASLVYAVDVGHGQLHDSLRARPEVDLIEKTDIRTLSPTRLGVAPDFIIVDVSFISLKLVLPPAVALAKLPAQLVALIKPQFEAGRAALKKGIVRDPSVHVAVCDDIAKFVTALGGTYWALSIPRSKVATVTPSSCWEPRVTEQLTIARLGHRGDGVAETAEGPVYVPYTLPGEIVTVDTVAGHPDRRHLLHVEKRSHERAEPVCKHFGTCGGCALQHWSLAEFHLWKRSLVVEALAQANILAPVSDLIDAHGAGRRRAVFHARRGVHDVLEVGFTAPRAHHVVPIDACPILAPGLGGALRAAWAIAEVLKPAGKPLDIQVSRGRHRSCRTHLVEVECL